MFDIFSTVALGLFGMKLIKIDQFNNKMLYKETIIITYD